MTINKRAKQAPPTPDAFIAAAPDGTQRKGVKRGRKEQITLTITPDLLAKLDALAGRTGQSRAALINLGIYRVVEGGVE
jgi:Ribbon-helix-helix protein, copG family